MPTRFLKIPHIPQRSATDCLVACTAMVLEFAEFPFDYNRLRQHLGTTDAGTPHNRIRQLARVYSDLTLTYRVGDSADIVHFIEDGYPVIVFVNTEDLPYWDITSAHAVVVVGYSDQDFYLHDPALHSAPQSVSHGDLLLAWESLDSKLAVVQRKP